MRYRLVNNGYPWRDIMSGRQKVGRVYRHASGHYVGSIKPHEATGNTFEQAFHEVCARAFGYPSAEALNDHNSQVRSVKRRRDRAFNTVADAFLTGSSQQREQILDAAMTNPKAAAEFVNAVGRRIFRRR